MARINNVIKTRVDIHGHFYIRFIAGLAMMFAFYDQFHVVFLGKNIDFVLQESGDVLLFSLRFTKKPKILGVDWSGAFLRRDSLSLWTRCVSCGSDGTPCPES